MSSTPSPLDELQAKAASAPGTQADETPDASKAALRSMVAPAPEAAPAAPSAPEIPAGSPWHDAAKPVLDAASISQDDKANIWDMFHQSKSPDELADKIATLAVPDELKHNLWLAKQAAAAPVGPVDKVTAAINKMVALPADVLDKAEQHPNVLRAITAATKE
jgi:hypothetical protein